MVGMKRLTTLLLFVFHNVFVCLVDVLWCFGFSRRFSWFCKNFREHQQTKNNKSISKGGSETFNNFVLLVFPKVLLCVLWLSFVSLVFPMVFVGFLKTFGNTKNRTQTHIQGWVWNLSILCLFGFPECFCWFSLVVFCMFGFPEALSRWSRCLGFRY